MLYDARFADVRSASRVCCEQKHLTGAVGASSSDSTASVGRGPELVGVVTFVGVETCGVAAADLAAIVLAAPALVVGCAGSAGGGLSTCQLALAVGCVNDGTCTGRRPSRQHVSDIK